MGNLEIEIEELDETLQAFLDCRSRFTGIMGPLGSGKTYTAILRVLLGMIEQEPNAVGIRPTRWIAVRNTYPDLTTTTIRDFREVFDENFGTMTMGGLDPPTFRARFNLDDGTRVESDVIFYALDRQDAIRRLRGVQTTGFWLNEAMQLQRDVVALADLRHGRYPSDVAGGVRATWHGIIADTNAPDEDNWYYKAAHDTKSPDWEFFRQPGGVIDTGVLDGKGNKVWVANPDAENLPNLPDGYYERALQGNKTDDWIANMLGNEYSFIVDGKPVHPDFRDSLHVTQENVAFNPELPLVIGVDFGRTPAAAIGQRDAWGRINIIDEFVSDDMSQAVFGPELRAYITSHYPQAKVRGWSDPAGEAKGQATEDTPRQVLVAAGVPCQPAPSNKVVLRRASVANPLRRLCGDKRPALMISPKARIIRKGLAGGFCFRRIRTTDDRYTEEPDKNAYSHPVEALEYLCLGEGEGRAALLPVDYDPNEPIQEIAEF